MILVGCGRKEIVVYDVPSDEAAEQQRARETEQQLPPMMQNQGQQPPAMSPMLGQSLPAESLGTADTPSWSVPTAWRQGPQSQIRRGSFFGWPTGQAG
ncbi:MAG: hypothetical protein LR015_13230 [Verrucomicrobia bacterium]|nr:hypothetical protein [Verrucomicrobiota bacterium]